MTTIRQGLCVGSESKSNIYVDQHMIDSVWMTTTRYDMTRYGMWRHGTIWHGMRRHGTIWHVTIIHSGTLGALIYINIIRPSLWWRNINDIQLTTNIWYNMYISRLILSGICACLEDLTMQAKRSYMRSGRQLSSTAIIHSWRQMDNRGKLRLIHVTHVCWWCSDMRTTTKFLAYQLWR